MNKIMVNIVIILLSATLLVGCYSDTPPSTNPDIRPVNVVLPGEVMGVAPAPPLGGGVVAGSLIGGFIGNNMDSSDNMRMDNAMENNPTNQTTNWKNPSTGTKYVIAPTSSKMTINGNPDCRRFYTTAELAGKRRKMSGVACRQPEGSWVTVNV